MGIIATMVPVSAVYMVKNGGSLFAQSLKSIYGLVSEIIVVDSASTDDTAKIARIFGAVVIKSMSTHHGKLRNIGLSQANNEWVLFIDHDEIVSQRLKKELERLFAEKPQKNAYWVPFQNHLFGRPLKYGGETYKKLALCNKHFVRLIEEPVHDTLVPLKKTHCGNIKNVMLHYSYRSPIQMVRKFTNYAQQDASEKYNKQEKVTMKQLFLYAPHMIYSRFIKDKGYRDGFFSRLFLDCCFGYMEGLTYWLLLYYTIKDGFQRNSRNI